MEVSRNMPEEVKNQVMPDGKKRVVTEKIPEKFVKRIQDGVKKKQKLTRDFLQISVNIVNFQRAQQELIDRLKSNDDNITETIKRAGQKMKLGKRKEYNWRYDGRDSFIGVYNPPKPKKPEPPKPKA